MNRSTPLPSLATFKDHARRLRARLEADGRPIGYSQSLELQAHQHGFKDWNTLHAAIGNRPPQSPLILGDRVRGTYLGQSFAGEVIGLQRRTASDRFAVTLLFDEPVDVVKFDSFSAFRHRVRCVIDRHGKTTEKTSDGQPHLQLEI